MVKYMEVLATAILCLLSVSLATALPQDSGQTQHSEQAQLYFFTMDGCGPCAQMEPEIQRLADAGYPVRIVDAKANPAWTNHFSVSATPTSVLVVGNKTIRKQSGIVSAADLAQWFHDHAATTSRIAPTVQQPPTSQRQNALASTADRPPVRQASQTTPAKTFLNESIREASSDIQLATMQATVRLKVEDEGGFSYATGTVIHSHGTEAIVLTCGHVFREWTGRETITADIGWGRGEEPTTVPARLLDYDAGPKDVAIVVIQPGFEIPAVAVAPAQMVVSPGDEMFSVGCDMGKPPSIRKTRIKALSNYDGADKYDIFGRPIEGRSGGGLFSAGGQLVGVCNAAAVDYDEGIYSSLANIWNQLARTNLDRLMVPEFSLPESDGADTRIVMQSQPTRSSTPVPTTNVSNTIPAQSARSGDMELIAVLRDRNSGATTTWVIDQPGQDLTRYLAEQSRDPSKTPSQCPTGDDLRSMADLRNSMPELGPLAAETPSVRRGQSPDPTTFRR